MTAPSEEEWKDAIAEWLQLGEEYDPEGCHNAADDLLGSVLVPLRERERQQARQEALTEAAVALVDRYGWRENSGLLELLRHWAAAGGVS